MKARARAKTGAWMETRAGMKAKVETRLDHLGVTVLAGSAADLGALIAEDTEKWANVIRAANIKPD
jgi:hypothetical protein